MLVVVEHGDSCGTLQIILDGKTLWRSDVFQYQATEVSCQTETCLNYLLSILCIQGYGHGINTRKGLEKNRSSFEHRQRRFRSGISKSVN